MNKNIHFSKDVNDTTETLRWEMEKQCQLCVLVKLFLFRLSMFENSNIFVLARELKLQYIVQKIIISDYYCFEVIQVRYEYQ